VLSSRAARRDDIPLSRRTITFAARLGLHTFAIHFIALPGGAAVNIDC